MKLLSADFPNSSTPRWCGFTRQGSVLRVLRNFSPFVFSPRCRGVLIQIKSIPWRPQRFGLTRGHIFSLWIWCVLDLEVLTCGVLVWCVASVPSMVMSLHYFQSAIHLVIVFLLLSWSVVTGPTDGSYIVHRSSFLEDGVWGCSLSSVVMSPRRYLEHGFLHPPLVFAVDFVTNATGRVLAVEQSVYSWIVDVSFG
ncbi:hypothetical protein F2Q69_00060071 [Brassica cretica]|uniref:Transmembrane protein n=1 Tax=Brassica cretica TaxID=69181 RepID=A0A8S9RIE7_BRACR|nr:hypothetical protein F2Q69_00060071 [Brassica cretica]